jgi:hypothetical protein
MWPPFSRLFSSGVTQGSDFFLLASNLVSADCCLFVYPQTLGGMGQPPSDHATHLQIPAEVFQEFVKPCMQKPLPVIVLPVAAIWYKATQ